MTEKNLIKTFIYKEELELLERYTFYKMSTVKYETNTWLTFG